MWSSKLGLLADWQADVISWKNDGLTTSDSKSINKVVLNTSIRSPLNILTVNRPSLSLAYMGHNVMRYISIKGYSSNHHLQDLWISSISLYNYPAISELGRFQFKLAFYKIVFVDLQRYVAPTLWVVYIHFNFILNIIIIDITIMINMYCLVRFTKENTYLL